MEGRLALLQGAAVAAGLSPLLLKRWLGTGASSRQVLTA